MVKESSSHGLQSGGKSTGTFTERFAEKCDSWLKNQTTETQLEETRVKTNPEDPGNKIFGFDNEIKSLKHFLLNQKVNKEFKSLVIVGEYGVGKTALCKTIFNHDDVKSVYAPRIWVSMDREEDDNNTTTERLDGKIYVLKKILTALGVKDLLAMIKTEAEEEYSNRQEAGLVDGETAKEKELSALLYALHLNLRWKKYLIVFDDVRKYLKGDDHWDEKLDVKLKEGEKWGKYLSDGFPKGSGGRVIYTTRDEKLAKELVPEEHEIHRLWPLSDSTSVWNIYDAVLKDKKKESPRNDKKCIDELMNKSRGLPLAARLLAELKPVFVDDIEKADQNDSTTGESTGTADNTTS